MSQENVAVFMREQGKEDNAEEGIADKDNNLPDISAVQKKKKEIKGARGSTKPHLQIHHVPSEVDSASAQRRKDTLMTATEPHIHVQSVYPDSVGILSSKGKAAVPGPTSTAELKKCTPSTAIQSVQPATTMSQKEKGEMKQELEEDQKELPSCSMTNNDVGRNFSGLVEMGTLESKREDEDEEVKEFEYKPEMPLHGQHPQVTPHSSTAAKLDGRSISVSADLDKLKRFTKRKGLGFAAAEFPIQNDRMRDMTAPTETECQENQRIVSYAVENNMAVDLSTMKGIFRSISLFHLPNTPPCPVLLLSPRGYT